MKRIYLLHCLLAFTAFSASAQNVDSISIVKLKAKLPALKDTERVNCLVDIAREYFFYDRKTDSLANYISMIKKESEKIKYNKGFVAGVLFETGVDIFDKKNLTKARKNLEQVTKLVDSVKQPGLYADLLGTWGELLSREKSSGTEDLSMRILHFYQLAGDIQGEAEVTNWICSGYLSKGKYEEGFDYCDRALRLSKIKRTNTIGWGDFLVQFALSGMADLYSAAGDNETSMAYLKESNDYEREHRTGWKMDGQIADLYCSMGQTDSAMLYWNKWRNNPGWAESAGGHKAWGYNVLARIYMKTNQYEKAIPLFKSSIDTFVLYKNWAGQVIPLVALGEAYLGNKDYQQALKFTLKGMDSARKYEMRPVIMQAYQQLAKIQHALGDHENAYSNLERYMTMKDSLQNKQLFLRLNDYKRKAEDEKKQAMIMLLQKNDRISQQQLKQEATIKYFLLLAFFALVIAGIFVYRNLVLKRRNDRLAKERIEEELKMRQMENDKKQTELQQRATELEMQALRTQMNPHFIFNCLSSINRFILKNETEIASDYLTRFSRLIRMVLINSRKPLIALEDELEMLRLYLDLERMRFHEGFDYHISFKNTIDVGDVLIPPLILQPFCENAIWHGLMQKEGAGSLEISLNMEDNALHCSITDNGIGRDKAEAIKSKSVEKDKSLGLKITSDRLDLFNRNEGMQTSYHIEDLYDDVGNARGTRVNLRIRYEQTTKTNS
ncbi:MAG TPA: histidine kinase [Chitinophagaceae bacterium]|nr:histidine kinase [Chitinophagaceae bacterium]